MLPTFLFSALDLEEVEGSSSFTKKSPFLLRSQFLLEPSILLSPMYWFHERTANMLCNISTLPQTKINVKEIQ